MDVFDRIRNRTSIETKIEVQEHIDEIVGHHLDKMNIKMPILKILIGISASGKSTWCKEFVAKNDKWCIVSRDDYRYAWQNKGVVDAKLESIINTQVKGAIQALNGAGYNVLYDATNLKRKYIRDIAAYVKYTATVEYQIFDVPKEVAIDRDSKRERSVGADVIERQYKDYLTLLDSHDFAPIKPSIRKYNPPKFDDTKWDCVIVDIDGTLAHTSGKRSHYDMTKVRVDDCDYAVKEVINLLRKKYKIVVVTGRDEFCRTETQQWLVDNGISYDSLLMRKDNDKRKDSVIKEEIFWNQIDPNYNVLAVFDDRDQVVSMWRELGIKTFQCEYGNF